MTSSANNKAATKRARRMARESKPQGASPAVGEAIPSNETTELTPEGSLEKTPTKTAVILGLLARPEGATLAQMVDVTSWLPHTTRAALTGLKKKGHVLTSDKVDGVRTYRIAQAGSEPTTPSAAQPAANA